MDDDSDSEKLRFLCDEMLRGLARWLRAAGYDTKTAQRGTDDKHLLQQALAEQRWLITRDRKLMERKQSAVDVVLLSCNDTESCVRTLSQQLPVDWLFNPFTRCLLCNTPLETADPDKLHQVPEESRKLADPLLFCPTCNKIYWDGGHVDRMRRRLQHWAAFRDSPK